MEERSFFFGPSEVAAIRRRLRPPLRDSASTFDLVASCVWLCRIRALRPGPEEEVRMICLKNARAKFDPPLPEGYYGNALALPVAVAVAGELCWRPLRYAVGLVRRAKAQVTEEYMHSVADLMVLRGRPHIVPVWTYEVSDLVWAGFGDVDFGWGRPIYAGVAKGGFGAVSLHVPAVNADGEKGIVVPICLPFPAMGRFAEELESILKGDDQESSNSKTFVKSSL